MVTNSFLSEAGSASKSQYLVVVPLMIYKSALALIGPKPVSKLAHLAAVVVGIS